MPEEFLKTLAGVQYLGTFAVLNFDQLAQSQLVQAQVDHMKFFLEDDGPDGPYNFYLGMCDQQTMKTWQFCSPELAQQRKNECTLDIEYTPYSRVHRRFCDIHYITLTQRPCNCGNLLDTTLYKVEGFPTCFVNPLPDSLCGALNVCGLHSCNASTVMSRIHSVKCDPNCKGHKPFCEWPIDLQTAQFPVVNSLWSDWYQLEKKDDISTETRTLYYEAKCINKNTYQGGIDCLGPGTSCCPPDLLQCKCKTFLEDFTLKVRRWAVIPLEHTTPKPKDYDIGEDIVKPGIRLKKKNRASFVHSKREVQTYEDDNDDDDIEDEDIVVEEERLTRKAVLDKEDQQDEDDEGPSDEAEDVVGDSTIKKGRIVPKKNEAQTLDLEKTIFSLVFSIYIVILSSILS